MRLGSSSTEDGSVEVASSGRGLGRRNGSESLDGAVRSRAARSRPVVARGGGVELSCSGQRGCRGHHGCSASTDESSWAKGVCRISRGIE